MAKDYKKQFDRTRQNKIKKLEAMLKVNPNNTMALEHLEKRKKQVK